MCLRGLNGTDLVMVTDQLILVWKITLYYLEEPKLQVSIEVEGRAKKGESEGGYHEKCMTVFEDRNVSKSQGM